MEPKRFYTIPEACSQLALSRSELYRALERKEIVATRIGRAVRFTAADLDAFVELKRRESRAVAV